MDTQHTPSPAPASRAGGIDLVVETFDGWSATAGDLVPVSICGRFEASTR